MIQYLRGQATGALLAQALEARLVRRIEVDDTSVAGYHAALYLQRQGYPFNCTAYSIEFNRRPRQ